MRTWFNAVPLEHHARVESLGRFHRGRPDAKKRVPVPVHPVHRNALAKETGCPEGITARRTARALA
jgi:hypothetical protein